MSVIDFIAVRRTKDEQASHMGTPLEEPQSGPGTLTASQFTRHITHMFEDEMRRALKRHVNIIDPHEIIDMAKIVADMKARYLALPLTIASNKTQVTDQETNELRSLRVKIQEMEAAYNEINEAIVSQLVEVKGVSKE